MGITQAFHDEIATELENRQQELNDRLKLLTNDNKLFQVTASYLLDLAQRADELFKESDDGLRQKLLEYLLSNIELKDKKLSYMLNDPFKTIIEAKKKSPNGSESNLWCGYRDSNPGPLPWQGSALSAELHPRVIWWHLLESNQRRTALQAVALPTELRCRAYKKYEITGI